MSSSSAFQSDEITEGGERDEFFDESFDVVVETEKSDDGFLTTITSRKRDLRGRLVANLRRLRRR